MAISQMIEVVQSLFRSGIVSLFGSDLSQKVILITGASSGIGRALATELHKHGCKLILASRNEEELKRLRDELNQTNTAGTFPPTVLPLDVSNFEAVAVAATAAINIHGHIDVLINNAGISVRGTVDETELSTYKRIMNVNFFGSVALTKGILPQMLEREDGHIVFISSIQGFLPIPFRSAYSAAKHAIQAFSDSLRAEVAEKNISVTTISPGYVQTKLSMNALKGDGTPYGVMDATTTAGYDPDVVARYIVDSIRLKTKQVIYAPSIHIVAIWIRSLVPSLFFKILETRAKSDKAKQE